MAAQPGALKWKRGGIAVGVADDISTILKWLADLIRSSPAWFGRMFGQILMAIVVVVVIYGGLVLLRGGSLIDAYGALFPETAAEKQAAALVAHQAAMQAEVIRLAASDKQIQQILNNVLVDAPGAARVRLGVIHDGSIGMNGEPFLKWDVTHAAAAPGMSGGPFVEDAKLDQWAEYLPNFIKGACLRADLHSLRNPIERQDWMALGIEFALACPVTEANGILLGAVFASWQRESDAPRNDPTYTNVSHAIASHTAALAATLALQPQEARPPAAQTTPRKQ